MSLSIDVETDSSGNPRIENFRKILETIEREGHKTTLFATGEFLEKNKDIISEAYENGHEIANHSYSHKKFFRMGEKEIDNDVKKSTRIIKEICKPVGFRAPCCSFVDFLPDILKKYGYKYDSSIMHSIKQPNLNYPFSRFEFKNGIVEFPFSSIGFMSMDWRAIKYWPIFKLFSEISKKQTITNVHSWSDDFRMIKWICKKFKIIPISKLLDSELTQ